MPVNPLKSFVKASLAWTVVVGVVQGVEVVPGVVGVAGIEVVTGVEVVVRFIVHDDLVLHVLLDPTYVGEFVP